ncbi:MAG: rhodanese-like domain-containing protein [Firmicutes bacterium HGW-Firmicutes-12]|nr:MAG: rhodanese-like domain-containing protein [Firmicutes bacterium HGW-Firmicutes-12]
MNKDLLFVSSLILIFAIWTLLRNAGIKKISPLEAKQRLERDNGIILLDVRTKKEYLDEHILKSTLIPLDVLTKEASKKLPDKNAPIFVYCQSGSRSVRAIRILLKMGYKNVYNLGGIGRWPYPKVSPVYKP